MRKKQWWALSVLVGILAMFFVVGCTSAADKVSTNIGKDCEQFKCQRRIVGVNGITDKVEFVVEGRCSIEGSGLGGLRALVVLCKQAPGDGAASYKKHYIGMSDNMFFISTQLKGLKESEYRTKILLKPENVVPDFDLITGDQP
jgi:hypothetical protein